MSIKTTHYVTREFAIAAILTKLHTCTDEQLENILEEAIHNGFYNFIITTNEVLNSSEYALTDITNLPEYNDAW